MESQKFLDKSGIEKKKVEFLKKSKEKIGYLYPVLIDKEGNIIDGRHRKLADPNWPEKNLDLIGIDSLIALGHANWYRWNREQKIEFLRKLGERTGWKGRKKFSEELGIPEQTLSPYLPQEFKDILQAERASAPRLGAERIFDTNVWQGLEKRPVKEYGSKDFQGNTPPLVAFELIKNYTEEGDLVLDPMAGSGTLIDVCKELNRKCLAFDIKKWRPEIEICDAERLPVKDESVDFIFAHWPYWQMVKYSNDKNDLSNLSYEEFLSKSERIIKEMKRILKPNGYFSVLIGNLRKNGKVYPLTAELTLMGCKFFELKEWIVWLGKGQRSFQDPLTKTRGKIRGYYPLACDILLVFKKVEK